MQNDYTQLRNDHIPTVPTFNPLTHIPPSYDIYGHQIPIKRNKLQYNILSEKEDIKTPWDSTNPLSQSTPMTRTKLLELRKKENIPENDNNKNINIIGEEGYKDNDEENHNNKNKKDSKVINNNEEQKSMNKSEIIEDEEKNKDIEKISNNSLNKSLENNNKEDKIEKIEIKENVKNDDINIFKFIFIF